MYLHGFRHTHTSLFFESEEEHKEVQERLGHENITTTLNIYTHVTNKLKEKTAQNFLNYNLNSFLKVDHFLLKYEKTLPAP
ncbi:tyrosine-type recombinase/integrase [Salipaludibacillus agaradhaerens]|uniref:tyrosine-type recombinase/integrase n=1 Tax=Salipaludibacillus agaradhaerens TaxID=76935 RepID=UPI0021516325|nr:tyrosine-type recombinase/integrase [Salipaludibacillus agaradhaerens]MCR6116903.1 tyrosine-type recombinase/integrase [Salipaludibacillus agaradhaerens]